MFAKLNLQPRLVSAFLLVALIVLAFAFVGYRGTQVLSNYINTLNQTRLPNIEGLWKIDRGQNQIESSECLLLVPEILPEHRQAALKRIDQAWSQINNGFNLVDEGVFKTDAEKIIYQKFRRDWNTWQQAHQQFIQVEQEYDKLGIRNPEKVRADLLSLSQQHSREMNGSRSALFLRSQLYETKLKEESLFKTANNAIVTLLETQHRFSAQIQQDADQQVNKNQNLLTLIIALLTIFSVFIGVKFFTYIGDTTKKMNQNLQQLREEYNQIIEAKEQKINTLTANIDLVHSQLIQSEKMSNLGQAIAGLAHEINNPINFIYGNITHASGNVEDLLNLWQLYQRQYPHPATQIQRFAEEIDVNFIADDLPKMFLSMKLGAERIRQIVSFLRKFSRIDEGEMQAVNINQAIDDTLLILNYRLKRGIQIIKNYGKLPQLYCYQSQINLVLMNVLANAIDALLLPNEKTTKNISIQTKFLGKKKIAIKIRDNGLGIPPQMKEQIFEPFFTTKQGGKGVGLGLYICYQIIEKHGGKLEVCSDLGMGTEFAITLPIKRKI